MIRSTPGERKGEGGGEVHRKTKMKELQQIANFRNEIVDKANNAARVEAAKAYRKEKA